MKRSMPTRPRVRPRSARQRGEELSSTQPTDRFRIVYVVIASLVICSMLAVAFVSVDFSGFFGSDGEDGENYVDQQADIIADQETVVADNPDDVNEIVLLANMLGNTGRHQDAIPWYEKAIEMAPKDYGIRLDFARMLASAGLTTDAETQFMIVLEAEPENQPANYYLGQMYVSQEPPRTGEAIEHYQRAVESDSSTFLAEQAQEQLDVLQPGSPVSSPAATPD